MVNVDKNIDKNLGKIVLWHSIDNLASELQKAYSVTGKDAIRKQYQNQIKQYPLYFDWFKKIDLYLTGKSNLSVLEYGPGPGLLAKRLVENDAVSNYVAIEPENIFREMTSEQIGSLGLVVDDVAENYISLNKFDLIVATATYHHFDNKLASLKNIYANLRSGGQLLIADVFLPNYSFDSHYSPLNKSEFIESVMQYSAAQILAMGSPQPEDIIDQIKTAFLDILRIEELKVSTAIVEKQLRKTGFNNIKIELMVGDNNTINYHNLGYYFITANKGGK